jgi:hypothetical protein
MSELLLSFRLTANRTNHPIATVLQETDHSKGNAISDALIIKAGNTVTKPRLI